MFQYFRFLTNIYFKNEKIFEDVVFILTVTWLTEYFNAFYMWLNTSKHGLSDGSQEQIPDIYKYSGHPSKHTNLCQHESHVYDAHVNPTHLLVVCDIYIYGYTYVCVCIVCEFLNVQELAYRGFRMWHASAKV